MKNENILWFKDINKNLIPQVGGKGANLGEMLNAKFPIPNGFVVTAHAYEQNMIKSKILEKIENLEKNADVNNIEELTKRSEQIKKIILDFPIEQKLKTEIISAYRKLGQKTLVAVRSSATAEDLPNASFAGQQDTYLNIFGEEELIKHVKKCWASLFNPRAIFYRQKQNFPIEKVKIAVVVQKLVKSDVSGILFTANPATSNINETVVEACYGLGEAIVSGSLTPDTYIVSNKNGKILSKNISAQTWLDVRDKLGIKKETVPKEKQKLQKMTDEQIIKFAKIGLQIDKHYEKPQDIEWAIENNELFVVQSRPITTLKDQNQTTKNITNIEPILKGLGASFGIESGPAKIVRNLKELNKIKTGDVMVTEMTTPDMVPEMKKAKAIITDKGGVTCHAAIVSRELGIPAVVGTEKATKILKDNQIVTVDANKGFIYDGEILHKENINPQKMTVQNVERFSFVTHTKVKVNVAISDAAERASQTGAEGIGLLRAEHLLTSTQYHPIQFVKIGKAKELQKILERELEKILVHFKNKPVFYRLFDARTDEFRNMKLGDKEPKEDNPMLGWHGIRRSLDEVDFLKTEYRAIRSMIDKGYKNIGVMIPFTQHVKEYTEAKKIAESAGLLPHKDCLFGIMVETPGCSLTIDDYIDAKIDFVSFGTNDLTQLTLGLDRNNDLIQKWFTELHPAILKQIAIVIKACKPKRIITSICGQAGSNPEMVKELVKLGIDSISANIDAVEKIKETVYVTEKEIILERIQNKNLEKKTKL